MCEVLKVFANEVATVDEITKLYEMGFEFICNDGRVSEVKEVE